MQAFLFVYIMFRAIFQLIGWVIKGFLYVLWMIFGGIAYLVNYLMERRTYLEVGDMALCGVSINHLIAR